MNDNMKLSPERLGILAKLGAAIQQGEQMEHQGQAAAEQARREAEEFLSLCAKTMDVDYPETFDFRGDRFVPKPLPVAAQKR